MYTIQIVGAGYTGSRIAEFFRAKRQKVFAMTRSAEKAEAFKQSGIYPVLADLTKPETLDKIPPAHFIVLCPAPDEGREAMYEAIYLKGIASYLNAAAKNPRPHLIVYISSTGVWQDNQGDWFDETIPPAPQSPKAKILAAAEKQVLECGMPAAVLRLSGIYGPGRNRLKAFREGKWPFDPAQGRPAADRWMNLIHVEDIAAMLPEFFKSAREGEIYLGTDDEPVHTSVLAGWLAEKTGTPNTFSVECKPAGRRLKNDKLKSLGIRLKYPTYREGYEQILSMEKTEKSS